MKTYTTKTAALALLLTMSFILPALLCADGAGGVYWGSQKLAYPWESEHDPLFSSSGDKFGYVGGMGYGISADGHVSGGFGFGFSENDDNEEGISGGFGGMITGYRVVDEPINLFFLIYAGLGGVSDETSDDPRLQEGSFAIMGEACLEASLPLTFFHPTLYVGYQTIASVGEGGIGDVFLSYAPTLGIRLLWGAQ